MNEQKIFSDRRLKLLNLMEDGVAVIASNELLTRSNDTEHPFRQNSNFYYFTGFLETNSVLVLSKKGNDRKVTLFLEEKVPEMELWTGKRLGPKEALNMMIIDQAYPIEKFEQIMPEIITGSKNLYINGFDLNKTTKAIYQITDKLWKSRKKSSYLPTKIHHLDYLTENLRLVKEPIEVEYMKEAVKKTTLGHKIAMAKAKPGLNERDIHAIMDYTFKMNLGDGPAYGMIVASGDNANVLHYIENNSILNDGDLLLIDAGAEHKLYASDVTRTFPVNGKFTEIQAKVYNEVLKAQELVIDSAKPGMSLSQLHELASKSLAQSLVDLGILTESADIIYSSGKLKKYYPHGTGHWLGLDVHDQCPYLDDQCNDIKLKAGMVFTVEPGLYFPEDDTSIPQQFRGIGIRIEDDILMTEKGNENLTKDIPKTIEEIELACQADYIELLKSGI